MKIDELVTKRNVVMSYNKNGKSESYLRKMLFETKPHFDRVVSVNLMTSTIDTVSLGDGKISSKIADPNIDLTDVKPGVFDIEKQVTAGEIADFDDKIADRGIDYFSTITQNVNDHLSQICNTLAAKSLAGNYTHKATKGGNMKFNFGVPVTKSFTAQKITAASTILQLSAQTDTMLKEMVDKATSKEDVRILCSTEYYAVICAIVQANPNSGLVQQIDEPGIKINGWYYINDQASYKEVDGTIVNAIPAKGCAMIDKSKKGKVLFCDLGLEAMKNFKGENAKVVSAEGLPFVVAYDVKKGGMLNELFFMAAPVALPCLSKLVHGTDMV